MKKVLFLILIALPVLVSAQRFNGGLLVGFNASQIDGDQWSGYHKGGFMGGAYVFTEFKDKLGGQLEVKYSAKGSATSKNNPLIRKIRLQYIDLPLIISYEFIEDLKAEVGVSFNYLFKAQSYDGVWEEFDPPPNDLETAIVAGVNYRFFSRFDLNIRFCYSLSPIRSAHSGSSWGDGAYYNNLLSFGIYYQIGK